MLRKLFLTLLIIVANCPKDAFAYIDPGTGSILLQSLIATISISVGVIFGLRTKLALLLKRLFGRVRWKKNSDLQRTESDTARTSDKEGK